MEPSLLHPFVVQAVSKEGDDVGTCETGNDYDGRVGLRVSSIFVILAGSLLATLLPLLVKRFGERGAHRQVAFADAEGEGQRTGGEGRGRTVWPLLLFISRYFGSGIIIATAFIHLLAPAEEALRNECLTGVIAEYCWVEGIILMTIVIMFMVEFSAMRYTLPGEGIPAKSGNEQGKNHYRIGEEEGVLSSDDLNDRYHLSAAEKDRPGSDYTAQLIGLFILEFGIIFHSIFIGLTLAVAGGSEFTTLYVVLFFHQTFEGLGLGSRLAKIPWPAASRMKRWTPYILAIAYSATTPIAIAIGLAVRTTYPPSGRTTLIVTGVFDSISAGILMYTGLVELLAHEFIFGGEMHRAPLRTVWSAFALLCLGSGLMALLGRWA
ncbi:hypothetical protein ASPCAL00549 [Aspergillus calidoustus]|uniref:Uncharacterized protein n=1 Tax=Aspergillus calidoustus TaxID=454130 RepID=A0A0U5FQS5_ASPCI|nr:hypothetical protein ASPCAL00549 [Aspergillus calidoustus]